MTTPEILDWKSSHDIRYVEPITPLVVADVLDKAAAIVLERGWTHGRLGSVDGPMCARGAIYEALGGVQVVFTDQWAASVHDRTEETLRSQVPAIALHGSVAYWNDTDLPGADGVAETFQALAAQLRKENRA